jgi:3',5'-cyclic AMP phosphodiesterase CpdA
MYTHNEKIFAKRQYLLGLRLIISINCLLITCSKSPTNIPGDEDWSFIVFGDSRQGYGIYEKLAIHMGKVSPIPRMAFCVGDVMKKSGNEAEWIKFYNYSMPFTKKMPLYIARGNHEGNDSASESLLRKQIDISENKPFYYSIETYGKCFNILDTEILGEENSITNRQLAWLKTKLDSVSKEISISGIFIFMHRPLFRQSRAKGKKLKNADDLHALFQNYKKIEAVIAGHDHIFHYQKKDGINYIITGGAGAPLGKEGTGNYYHFLKLSFYKDTNSYNLKTIGVFNETIENRDL